MTDNVDHLHLENPSVPHVDPLVGRVLDGRYQIERSLGEGGMGLVYLATHVTLEKTLAIKVLRPEVSRNQKIVERFRQEARAATAVGNEHIIDVSDFGQLPDGCTYFVMEFLDGMALTDAIAPGQPMEVERTYHIAVQLCQALGAAHKTGIVHRDLKPDNIFLVRRGNDPDFVKVLDFGIAKVGGTNSKLTQAGELFGTPHYMSPEQCAGTAVDPRTDVYALGVILYEMTTSRVPFDASSFLGLLNQHLNEPPTPPHKLPPPVHATKSLEAVILRCLEKSAENRYQSMQDVQDALLRAQAEGGSTSNRGEPVARVPSSSGLGSAVSAHDSAFKAVGPGTGFTLGELDLATDPPPKPARRLKSPQAQRARSKRREEKAASPRLSSELGGHGPKFEPQLDPFEHGWEQPKLELAVLPEPQRRLRTRAVQREQETEDSPQHRAYELASYPETPQGLLGCLPYMARVLSRRMALRAQYKQLRKQVQQLRNQVDEALVDLGRALASEPPTRLERIKAEHQAVLDARAKAEAADQTAAHARSQAESVIRTLEQQVVQLQQDCLPFEHTVQAAEQVHAEREREAKKAGALLQRVDIEIRALHNAQTPPDPASIAELEAARIERHAKAEQARAEAQVTRSVLADAERELRAQQAEVERVQAERRKLVNETHKQQRTLEKAVAGAEGKFADHLRTLALAARECSLDKYAGEHARVTQELHDSFSRAIEEEEILALALGSYDSPSLWRGLSLAVGGLIATVAALLLL